MWWAGEGVLVIPMALELNVEESEKLQVRILQQDIAAHAWQRELELGVARRVGVIIPCKWCNILALPIACGRRNRNGSPGNAKKLMIATGPQSPQHTLRLSPHNELNKCIPGEAEKNHMVYKGF